MITSHLCVLTLSTAFHFHAGDGRKIDVSDFTYEPTTAFRTINPIVQWSGQYCTQLCESKWKKKTNQNQWFGLNEGEKPEILTGFIDSKKRRFNNFLERSTHRFGFEWLIARVALPYTMCLTTKLRDHLATPIIGGSVYKQIKAVTKVLRKSRPVE